MNGDRLKVEVMHIVLMVESAAKMEVPGFHVCCRDRLDRGYPKVFWHLCSALKVCHKFKTRISTEKTFRE